MVGVRAKIGAGFPARSMVSREKHKIRPVLTGIKGGSGKTRVPVSLLTVILSGEAAGGDRAV
jgi:hypothetical protein